MKQLFFILAVSSMLFACKKSATPTEPSNDQFDPATATRLASGNFINGSHPASGMVGLYTRNGVKKLWISNFSTDSGPDLRVYLAKDRQANSFISLGKLKSATGNQLYDISGMPDHGEYKYVLIWCQQFSVLFGSAELQ